MKKAKIHKNKSIKTVVFSSNKLNRYLRICLFGMTFILGVYLISLCEISLYFKFSLVYGISIVLQQIIKP